ncbi:hypothetical protein AGOR_G00161660 [Albula goreensis]|uniref:C2 tensin-type domain-containing protein n=1 Tax=Albula goreensis TaxID=1534307 RepID=A0A8T3D611_9TELE|nr:hypothetical protein AGOR_G00161660 [Albula goreensis]
MQLVYTSGVYDLQGSGSRRLCVTIEPALLLKGDIMVKCYHRQAHITERETVFRLQFHTCTIHGAQLWFGKEELDEACSDDRFPSDATVEFVFSYGPEKIPGREYQRNHPAVTVDYNTADPVVRWDSYENFNLRHQDSLEDISHTRGPLDGSLYAQVKKRRGPGSGGLSPSNGDPSSLPSSPSPHPEDVLRPLPPSRQDREEFDCLLSGADSRRMRGRERERETAILDDSDAVPSERGRGMALGRRRSCRCSMGCEEPGCDGPVFLPNGCCPKTSNGHLIPPALDLCQHHHPALPPPELLWERQQAPSPCIQGSLSDRPSRRLCPCPAQELPLPPHAHTLPTPRLLYKGDGYTPILHHYAHMHHPHPSSPYREMMLLDVPAHPGCLCRDCRCRREESAVAVKAFHGLRLDQGEGSYYSREAEFLHREAELRRGRNADLEWDREAELQREAGLRRGRDVAHHWDRHREAEMQWEREVESRHRRSTLAPYGPQHSPHGLDPSGFIFDPLPSGHPAYPEASHCHSYAYSHSHMDPKYNSASSGYQTPTPPYPCGPYHPSPSESRGYASGYQSESTSPQPNHGQAWLPWVRPLRHLMTHPPLDPTPRAVLLTATLMATEM